jgi:glycosyltransferase involved in cell wall biosynthesis
MKISVIIPVYNSSKYLDECLKSVLSQTYTDLEIIIVDDGSNDGSSEICDKYANIDKRIIVIHKSNEGVSKARNDALKLVSGDFVTFVDSDDTLDEDMYELLVDLIIKYKADIAHCGYKHIVGDEIRLVHNTQKVYIQNQEEALQCLVGGKLFVGSLWNKLYKASLIKDLQFRIDLKINEDILFNFEAFLKAKKIVFADYTKYNYIAHINSSACFTTSEEKNAYDSCIVNEYIYNALQKNSLNDIAANRYLSSLNVYYRNCLKNKNNKTKCKEIIKKMWKIYSSSKNVSKNVKATVLLLRYFPYLYGFVYKVHNKVRKKNWEVGSI